MDKQQFTDLAQTGIRHGATVLAGVLAAKGFTSASNEVVLLAAAGSLTAASMAWSYISRQPRFSSFVSAVPFDAVSEMANIVQDFRNRGASPALVAHAAQVLATLATAEIPALATSAAAVVPTTAVAAETEQPPLPTGVAAVVEATPVAGSPPVATGEPFQVPPTASNPLGQGGPFQAPA